mgnify:CR=1 FL=1
MTVPVFSQYDAPVDSLKSLLHADPLPLKRGVLLNDISYAYSVYQFDSAYHYAQLAEAEGIAQKDTSVIARAYILQGSVASARGNLAESIRKTEQALDLALAINDSTNLANAYNNLALVDMDAGDAQQELTRLEVNYEVAQKNRANEILALEKDQAEQKVVNQRRLALLTVLILVLLLFTTLFLLWQRRQFSQQLELQVKIQTQELQKANQELEQSNQELERFTYIASHDLKEPLRNIISFTTLLERKKALWADHEDASDFFSHIKRSARQMHTLIQDVLAYAQVRGGQNKTALTRVDLNQIMVQIQEALQPQLEAKNAKLYSENLTFIEGTPHHFYIILKNLVENGLKYNEHESPMIIVRQALKTEKPRLLVIDNGIGIPDEFKPKVFDMFYRLHGRSQYEGTGLGLAIVQRLAESLGATIEISDRPGGGTIFSIEFAN